MTLEEIFSQIAQHMVVGLMFHSQACDFFNFLGLKGYSKCHKYHYFEENNNYKCVCDYYISHFNKLVIEQPFENPNLIPVNWYHYTRQDMDSATRTTAIKTGFEKWVQWERDTKKLYEYYYQCLVAINEFAAAFVIKEYIRDVDNELAEAEQKLLNLESIQYNISDIMNEQDEMYEEYLNKLEEIKLC